MKKLFILRYALVCAFVITVNAAEKEKLPIIAHWSFDNFTTNTIQDSGPDKLDAELYSKDKDAKEEIAKGMYGKALKFSDKIPVKYIVKDAKKLLNLKPPYTICCWIKKTTTRKTVCIFSKKYNTGYELRISWEALQFCLSNKEDSLCFATPRNSILNDIWYHVAASNDGKKITLYINCEPVEYKLYRKNKAKAQEPLNLQCVHTKRRAVIGNFPGRIDAYPFAGLLDELYVVSKVLSKDELYSLANPE